MISLKEVLYELIDIYRACSRKEAADYLRPRGQAIDLAVDSEDEEVLNLLIHELIERIGAYWRKHMTHVVIVEVAGGVAYPLYVPEGVELTIIDWDEMDNTTSSQIQRYIDALGDSDKQVERELRFALLKALLREKREEVVDDVA
jgi:hypothetical protein